MTWKLVERTERYDVYFSTIGEWFLVDANDMPDQHDVGLFTYQEAVAEYHGWNDLLAREAGQLELFAA
jgi:hypothetical protein